MKKLLVKKWDRYNNLVILEELKKIWVNRYFKCKCDCWVVTKTYLNNLRNWNTKTCWCLHKEKFNNKKHWASKTWIYTAWENMKTRCKNKNNANYKNWWWRWISYDPKWEKFEQFYKDMKLTYKKWLTLDRINNNWNYSKWYIW